jgi:hypothetical protein
MVVIGFSRPKGFKPGSLAIRAWMGFTSYSHVYLRLHSAYTDETLVYQASHGLVNCMHISAFEAQNKVVCEFVINISKENLRICVKKAQQLLGRPYGYLGLLKLVVRRLLPVKGDNLRTLHCSEFIGALFPRLAENIDADYLEPKHLFEAIKNGVEVA